MTDEADTTNVIASATDEELVHTYRQLRDHKQAEAKKLEELLAPSVALMGVIEGELLGRLNQRNADSVRTPHGTVYRQLYRSASMADPDQFKKFVIENGQWEMVDWKANVPAVTEFIDTNKSVPPGLNFSAIYVVRIRK